MRINDILVEFAPSGDGGGSGDYFQSLASAWYNGTFDSGSLQKGIKSQQDVERLLNRGIVCPDGVTRKYGIDYNSDFDGVVISSDDYYEHADHDETDSRTGKPFGPYDYMEFSDDDLSEGVTEADEWEEDTEKRERFLKYAKQKLMASNGNIEMASALSQQDNKIFGSPFLNDPAAQQAPAGAVSIIDNRPYTRAIAEIMAYIESKQGQAEISATQAALWLTPQGKKFLERVSTDLYGIDDNAARKKHAIALSGYQVQHLGGKITGSYYGPDDFHSAEQNMTKEVAAIYDLVTLELEREAGIEGDARERQKDMAFWNAIPYPLKVVMCASLGKTPGQMESILFGTEADMLASHFGNKKPKPNADPTPAEPKKLGETGIDRAVNDKGLTQHRWLQLVQTKFPDAKIVQAKMIDGPCRATLPDGRTLSWVKAEQGADSNNNSTGVVKPIGLGKFNPEFNKALQTGIDQRTAARDKMQANVATLPTYTKKGMAEAKASTASFRASNKKRAELNSMSDQERRAYDKEQQEKQRKHDDARLEREHSKNKGVAEGAPISGDGGAVDNFKQQMANNTELAYQSGMAEGNRKSEPPEADYGDDYQDMVKRVKKLAGVGPLKTQYDPAKRVYRNMPTAVQPKK